jgi:hypothetical protein
MAETFVLESRFVFEVVWSFWSHRKSSSKTREGGVLIAIKSKFRGHKRGYDLQLYE